MTYHHTNLPWGSAVAKSKIAVTLDGEVLVRIDRLVREGAFPNRSQAIERVLQQQLERLDRTRLARECAKLDPTLERALADEGLDVDTDTWPEY